jgi:hypothetical protein
MTDFEQIPKYEFKAKAKENDPRKGVLSLLISVLVVWGIGVAINKK